MKKVFRTAFLLFLKWAAKIQLWKIAPKHVVGITGSAGKSSTRDLVYAVLKDKFKVKSGKKSLNSEVGLPLDILGFAESYGNLSAFYLKVLVLIPFKLLLDWPKFDVYVAELGVDKPGDMDYLLSIVRPDVGVFLNALPVHTANFSLGIKDEGVGNSQENELVKEVAKEKGKLIESLPENGWAILNADDHNVIQFQSKTKAKVITFGSSGEVKPFALKSSKYLITEDYRCSIAAALAVGKVLGLSLSEAKSALEKNFSLPPGRMSLLSGIKKTTIIDSTYNASPGPMIAALRELADFAKAPSSRRKIAVLGDMRELGELTQFEHEKVAKEAVTDADLIFTFGPLMKEYFVPKAKGAKAYLQMNDLIADVKASLQPGDVILVKGSQNTILLETLVRELLANPEDEKLLCRRGDYWDGKRKGLLKSS